MSRASRAHVTAVVVVTSDRTYLPETLRALATQTSLADRVVVAGAGADDAWIREVLDDVGLVADVVDVGEASGPSQAVGRAMAKAEIDSDWLWLLHDDSAPEPEALAALRHAVETGRSIAVAGCKQVVWSQPDRLVSVGVQYTRDIQRFTGVEEGEVDQGQHDDREDVDAVGTAGMLIDRQVFLALGGADPALGSFGDGRDLSRRARLAGHRVVVVPRAVVRHARAGYLGLRREPDRTDPDRLHSFRERRASVLHARLVESPAALVPFVALAALLSGPPRAAGRLLSKELPLVDDELLTPVVALAGTPSIVRARRRARATRSVSTRRLRPLAATWSDVARVRRDQRMQAAAQRRTVRAPSELEMRERTALGTRRRLVLGGVMLVALVVAGLTLAPVVFAGPLLGGALLPSDAGFGELWSAAASPWLASGDGWATAADPFMYVLGGLSVLTGGPFGTPVWVTISILLVSAIPLSALSAWFAAGAATRSLALRAWAAIIWALAPPLVLALSSGRIGFLVAHVMLPLVALGLARAFGLDRRDVVISGLVGAQHVERRAASAPAVELRERRLAALAAVADDAPTGQIDRVLAGRTDPGEEPASGDDDGTTGEADDREERVASDVPDPEPDELATIVARPSGVGSVGAAAAAGLGLAAAAAGAPLLLPAGLLGLLLLAVMLGRRRSMVAGRSRLLLVAIPPLVLMGPLLMQAARMDDGWRLLFASPGNAVDAPISSTPALALLGWPQDPLDTGLATASPWLALAASATVLVAAVVALARGGGVARGVRLAWLIVAVGVLAAVLAPRVDVAVARSADGSDVVARGWAGPGCSLVLLGLLMATAAAGGGLRSALHGRSFGWRQLGVAAVSLVIAGGVILAAIGWTTMLRSDVFALHSRQHDPVPAIGDELQSSDSRSRVLALWSAGPGAIDGALWRSAGPQLTETSSVSELAALDAQGVLDPAAASLQEVVAGLSTGTATDVPARLAEHAIAVVVVPPADSDVAGPSDETARADLVSLLDETPGLERVTENDSGVVWRVSTVADAPARVVLQDAEGLVTPVAAATVTVDATIPPVATDSLLLLAERPDVGWHAWLDGEPLRSVTHDWRQAFQVPPGTGGELVVRYDARLHVPWQVIIAITFVAVALIAMPTRRRRLDPVEDA